MDTIVSFIVERWPVLAFVVAASVVTFFITKWYYNRFVPTEKKTEKNEKRLEDLPCVKHEKQIYSIRDFFMPKIPKHSDPI